MSLQLGARLVKRGLAWLRAWPWFVGSIVLGLLIKENFPFSHWPMYSNFSPSSAYVYVVNGAGAPRLPNTSSLSFEGVESSAALLLLDRQGICCSAGSACRTGSQEASHVLRAMNPSSDGARRSLRFSLGRFNSDAQIDRAIEVVPKVIEKLRQLSPVREPIVAQASASPRHELI